MKYPKLLPLILLFFAAVPLNAENPTKEIVGLHIDRNPVLGYFVPVDREGRNFYRCDLGLTHLPDETRYRVIDHLFDCPNAQSEFVSLDLGRIVSAHTFDSLGGRIGEVVAIGFAQGEVLGYITTDHAIDFDGVLRLIPADSLIGWSAANEDFLLLSETSEPSRIIFTGWLNDDGFFAGDTELLITEFLREIFQVEGLDVFVIGSNTGAQVDGTNFMNVLRLPEEYIFLESMPQPG